MRCVGELVAGFWPKDFDLDGHRVGKVGPRGRLVRSQEDVSEVDVAVEDAVLVEVEPASEQWHIISD